jgi:hypothetical protein
MSNQIIDHYNSMLDALMSFIDGLGERKGLLSTRADWMMPDDVV